MSDIEIAEEAGENPAELVPDIATVAEAGQPEEPEVRSTVIPEIPRKTLMTNDDSFLHHVRFLQNSDRYSWTARGSDNSEGNTGKFATKFTQTFFKFMKNLSDKRFVEIINMEVDHEDKSIVFYRPSCNEFIVEDFTPKILQF